MTKKVEAIDIEALRAKMERTRAEAAAAKAACEKAELAVIAARVARYDAEHAAFRARADYWREVGRPPADPVLMDALGHLGYHRGVEAVTLEPITTGRRKGRFNVMQWVFRDGQWRSYQVDTITTDGKLLFCRKPVIDEAAVQRGAELHRQHKEVIRGLRG